MTPEDLTDLYRRMDEGHGDAIDEGYRRAVEEVRKKKEKNAGQENEMGVKEPQQDET
jgi:hypothetical protein